MHIRAVLVLVLAGLAGAAPPATAGGPDLPPPDAPVVAEGPAGVAWVSGGETFWRPTRGTTRRLRIGAPRDLDVGRGPDGRDVLVFVRCRPGCDLAVLDLHSGAVRPVPAASKPGTGESLPTVWGSRVAFVREGRTWLAPLRGPGRATVLLRFAPEDLEMGPGHLLALFAVADPAGNEESALSAFGLRTGRWADLDSAVVGESCATAIGGLTARGGERGAGRYAWVRATRCGCGPRSKRTYRGYTPRTGAVRAIRPSRAMTRVGVPVPGTPASELCPS